MISRDRVHFSWVAFRATLSSREQLSEDRELASHPQRSQAQPRDPRTSTRRGQSQQNHTCIAHALDVDRSRLRLAYGNLRFRASRAKDPPKDPPSKGGEMWVGQDGVFSCPMHATWLDHGRALRSRWHHCGLRKSWCSTRANQKRITSISIPIRGNGALLLNCARTQRAVKSIYLLRGSERPPI